MSYMFYNCSSLSSANLSGLDVSKGAIRPNMARSFYGCPSLETLTLPAGLDLSMASLHNAAWKDLSGAVYETNDMIAANVARKSGLETYSLASATLGWNQSGSCEWSISDAGELTLRPLGDGTSGTLENWNYSYPSWHNQRDSIKSVSIKQTVVARTCKGMFEGYSSLEVLDLSGLDTSNVADMSYMFAGCTSLMTLDLSGLDTSNVADMSYMFAGCYSISSLTLPAGASFDITSIHDITWKDSAGAVYETTSDMFAANAARESGAMTYSSLASEGWLPSGTCEWRIDGEGLLVVRPLPDRAQGILEGGCADPWYFKRESIKSARIEPGVSARTCIGMFSGCTLLASVDLSELDTSEVTDMSRMFDSCSSLNSIYVSKGFATTSVELSDGMFYGCYSLVGGAGTAYDPSFMDASRARIDGGADAPGYLTKKREEWEGDANGNGVLNIVDAQIAYDIATTDLYKDRSDYVDICLRADITGDGTVHAEDAFAIQYAALRGW